MIKVINLAEKEKSIKALNCFKITHFVPYDVKITNSHIRRLNNKIGREIFKKDSLYVNSETLWEIMQLEGTKLSHNSHNLSPQTIYNVLVAMKEAEIIIETYDYRYLIVSVISKKPRLSYAVIIEPNGILKDNLKANVIRLITIYRHSRL